MKKYVAKLIPVEGEITVGDFYLNKDGEIKLFQNSLPAYHYAYAKKLELFLCSRDIQVGDKVMGLLLDKSGYKEHSLTSNKEEVQLAKDSGDFKIIGKVSPDAVWVKPDMEFDEEDIEQNGGHFLFYNDRFTHWRKTSDETFCYLKFRCPSSPNHFH